MVLKERATMLAFARKTKVDIGNIIFEGEDEISTEYDDGSINLICTFFADSYSYTVTIDDVEYYYESRTGQEDAVIKRVAEMQKDFKGKQDV